MRSNRYVSLERIIEESRETYYDAFERIRCEPEICDVTWNVLGILDLIVAVTIGVVVPPLFPNVNSAIPTGRDDATPTR
jgi:hypothetical protein